MPSQFSPSANPEQTQQAYTLRQIDDHGNVLQETPVVAKSYSNAVRELDSTLDRTEKIEVYNRVGEKAGEVHADYWRVKQGRP